MFIKLFVLLFFVISIQARQVSPFPLYISIRSDLNNTTYTCTIALTCNYCCFFITRRIDFATRQSTLSPWHVFWSWSGLIFSQKYSEFIKHFTNNLLRKLMTLECIYMILLVSSKMQVLTYCYEHVHYTWYTDGLHWS